MLQQSEVLFAVGVERSDAPGDTSGGAWLRAGRVEPSRENSMYSAPMRSDLEPKIFRTPEEAREDELNQYRAPTPDERVEILIELVHRYGNQAEHRLDRTPTIVHGQRS